MTGSTLRPLAHSIERLQAVFDQWQRALQLKHDQVAPIYAAGDGVVHGQATFPLTITDAETRVILHIHTAVDPASSPALARIARDLADELSAAIQQAQGVQA